MFELIEKKVRNILDGNRVSLAMIYDEKGEILWHSGRSIKGRNVSNDDCQGFSRSCALRAIEEMPRLGSRNVRKQFDRREANESDNLLKIKSLLIFSIGDGFLFYLDSLSRSSYSQHELGGFVSIGFILSDIIKEGKANLVKAKAENLGGEERVTFFQRVLGFIMSRSDDELAGLSVKSLAAEFNVSRRVLEYEFEKGAIRTAEYIDRYRLYRAAKLLKSRPDLTIEEIACRLGFSSCKYFRRCFKKFYRVLPHQCRIKGHNGPMNANASKKQY